MKIIFIMLTKFDINSAGNIYVDTIKELANRGNEIYVVSANEKRLKLKTEYKKIGGVNSLCVKTGNIQKTSKIEKGIDTVLIEYQYIKAIKKYFKGVKFELIIGVTPPITISNLVLYLKKKYNIKSYLLLKDIFPQNAVDLKMFSENSLIYKYFRKKEIKLYTSFDYIGCMSYKNKEYILNNNKYLDDDKVEICANSIDVLNNKVTISKKSLRKEIGVPDDKFMIIYGGNLGKPQGIDFLINILNYYKDNSKVFIYIIGSGTEFNSIKQYIEKNKISNVKLNTAISKKQYNKYVASADAGLILLDKRFTIPNFPSRILNYMEYSLPIIAATDKNTDLRECIRAGGFGEWCESGDIKSFSKIINKIMYDKELLRVMGRNSHRSLVRKFDVKSSVNKILEHFDQ